FIERPNTSHSEESRRLWPTCRSAELECGHVLNLGISQCRPTRMACYECGKAARSDRRSA
ncbi:MAG: hypothetical protein WA728_28495, partial [Xanthobacteraceae bacterium]